MWYSSKRQSYMDFEDEVKRVNEKDKEKMKALIEKKKGGGRSDKMETPQNDRTKMRKGPHIYIKKTL